MLIRPYQERTVHHATQIKLENEGILYKHEKRLAIDYSVTNLSTISSCRLVHTVNHIHQHTFKKLR